MRRFHTIAMIWMIVSLTLFAFQRLHAVTLEETFKKRIPFTEGGLISLSNANGTVFISSWDKEEVEIIALKVVKSSQRERAQDLMESIEIVVQVDADEIDIETKYPRGRRGSSGLFDWLFGGREGSYYVEYEIKVPRKADLNINTTNGGIEVEQIKGRLRLESTNGKILGHEIDGLVRCKTTNGSIRIEFSDVPGEEEMFFRTTNGSIRLYLPRNFGGEVELRTTNGHIDSDFPVDIHKKWSKEHYYGMINEGNQELSCATTNGSIYLYSND